MRERAGMPAADVMERYVAAARRHDFDTAFGMFAEVRATVRSAAATSDAAVRAWFHAVHRPT
jgi:poly-gamma-glutamate capsule biosynthesis protein CapA/YwtB (metallophosphatase superfamily)